MAISEDLLVSIKIDTKNAQKGVKQLTASLKGLDRTIDSGQKELKSLQSQLGKVAIAFTGLNQAMELAGKLMHSVGSAVGATLGNFSDFERGMLGVAKTTGQTREEAAALADEMQNLSEEIPVGTDELLGLAEAAGQLGVKGSDNLINFAETLAKLGTASDIAGESAARELARLLNITKESIDGVDELASVIVALGNNFATTESEIVRVASEVGRATSVFGLSSAEIVGVSTALKTMGVQAQLGGSAVGRAFREIDNAIRNGGVALADLSALTGKSGEELRKQFGEDAVGVFQLFIKGLNRVQKEGGSVAAAMDTLNLRGDEIAKTLPVLASGYDELTRALELANKEVKNATALDEEAAAAFNSLGADTEIFLNTLKSVGIEIGQVFAPAARSLLQFLSDIAKSFRDVLEEIQKLDFDELAKSIKNIGVALAAVGLGAFILQVKSAIAAVGGLSAAIAAMGGLSGILIQLKGFFASIAVSAKAALIPMAKMAASVVAIGAAAAAVDILIRNFGKLGDVLDLVLDSLELLGIKFVENIANKMHLAFAKAVFNVMKTIQKIEVGGVEIEIFPEENLINAQKNMSRIYGRMIKDNERVLELQTSIAKKSESIDFGIAGQMLNMFKDTNAEAEKLEKNLDKVEKPSKQISEDVKLTADQMKILNQMLMENKALESEINMIGRGNIDQIRERARLALLAVDHKEAELKLEGKLTKEMQKQFEIRRGLIEESAGRQIKQIGKVDVIPSGTIDALSNTISEGVGQFAGSINSALGGMASVASAIMAAANAIVSFIQSIIDFIPQIINGIAKIFTSLTELPIAILDAFMNLFDGITGFIRDFIPNVITMIEGLINGLVDFLIEGLPGAVESLMERLPDLLINLFENLPEIIERFIEGFINAMPRIVLAFADFMVSHAPRIALKIVEVMAVKVPIAIVRGFIKGAEQFVKRLVAFFSGKKFKLPKEITDLPNNIGNGIKNLGKSIAKETSDVFRVMDLQEAAKGLDIEGDAAEKLAIQITDAILNAAEILKKVWKFVYEKFIKPIEDIIKKAWKWVDENIITPFLEALMSVWNFINDNVLQPFIDSVLWVFDQVYENFVKPFIKLLDSTFNSIYNRLLKPFVDFVKSAFNPIIDFFKNVFKGNVNDAFSDVLDQFKQLGSKIWEGIKAGLNGIGNVFKNIFDATKIKEAFQSLGGIVADSITSVVRKIFNPLIDVLNGLKFPQVDVGGKVLGKSFGFTLIPAIDLIPGEIAKFNQGGEVFGPGRGDTVPALLEPGEFVMRRAATQGIGISALTQMNQTGKMPTGNVTYNFDIRVEVEASSQSLDESYVRNRLIPTMKDEFKRSSQRGEFLMSEKGIRA